MQTTKQKRRFVVGADSLLMLLTVVFIFYGFFEPYLNQIIGPIMKYYIIVLIALFVFRSHGKLQIEHLIKYTVLWLIFACITLLWAKNYEIMKLHFFTVFAAIILLVCITQTPIDEKWITYMVASFWFGSFLIGFLSLLSHSAYHFEVGSRQVLTLFGLQTDPNNQAIFLMYGISISTYYLIVKRERIILCLITIVVNILSMLMTASRGGFVSIGVLLTIIILVVVRDWKTKLWAIVATVFTVVVVFRYVPSFVSVASLERLTGIETYEGGGHRVEIWKSAFQLINENPLFYLVGSGWGSYYNYNGWQGMHNTYLEMFCNTGLIGILLFYYPVYACAAFLMKRKRYLPIFVVLSVLLPAFFIDSINKRFFWNALYFLFIYYYIERDKNDRSITESHISYLNESEKTLYGDTK